MRFKATRANQPALLLARETPTRNAPVRFLSSFTVLRTDRFSSWKLSTILSRDFSRTFGAETNDCRARLQTTRYGRRVDKFIVDRSSTTKTARSSFFLGNWSAMSFHRIHFTIVRNIAREKRARRKIAEYTV